MRTNERETKAEGGSLWRAEAMLRYDRRLGLAELERCFGNGTLPEGLDGPLEGRVVTTTFGYGLDPLFEVTSRLWMPWLGKEFDAAASEGRNRFDRSARPLLRALWPGYRDLREDVDGFTAFAFETRTGASVTHPATEVLQIRYDHPASPWPIRLILDELVAVGGGQHLGQALMRWRGGRRRVAWFALQPAS